jgi:predicted ATP-dependent protease
MPDTSSFPEVPFEKLRWYCDPDSLPGNTTDDVTPCDGLIGQERAEKALTLGIELAAEGYNVYVCGMTGTGKSTAVRRLLATKQGTGTPPPDLCYVFAFKNPDGPRLLVLPAGQGRALKKAMEGLMATLKTEVPQVLASESLQRRKAQHLQRARRREQRLLAQFEAHLAPHFGLLWRDADYTLPPELAPRLDERLIPFTELEERLETGQLTPDHYRHLREQQAALSTELEGVLANIQRLQRDTQEAIRTLERALVRPIMQQAVAEVTKQFQDATVQSYLQEVAEALGEEIDRFHLPPPAPTKETSASHAPSASLYEEDPLHEYQVNIVVDNAETPGTPVIFETSPTYKNLFGTIEPTFEYGGVWRSDFTGIHAGSIHRANGGYLVFHALDALAEPMVWTTLKRILRYGQAEIQAIDQLSLLPSTSLKPEPIPCRVKVIMLGDAQLYYDLVQDDDSFKRLFKVKADFDTTIPRHLTTVLQYAAFLAHICREERLRPCDRDAVAAIIEWAVRRAGRQNKLSARLDGLADILREADYWAGKAGAAVVRRTAVEQALRERFERVNLEQAKLYDMVAEGLLLLTTRSTMVGQVNGLSLYEWEEDCVFGCPMRITATTSLGQAGIVNIEREVEMSDATYDKGVLILSGYLRHAYAQDKPLILSASLCIEQSYGGITGDSASAAEMYALLSSLAACPVDQGIAVTGSVNQMGQIQPISGINEKIEGFFDICRMQGLTGTQGVLLPYQNIDDLMLRQDVIEAIMAGQFHLYPITTIDDGLPILTGIPAGSRLPGQEYPAESVNGRVDARLRSYAAQWAAAQGSLQYPSTARTPTVCSRRAP